MDAYTGGVAIYFQGTLANIFKFGGLYDSSAGSADSIQETLDLLGTQSLSVNYLAYDTGNGTNTSRVEAQVTSITSTGFTYEVNCVTSAGSGSGCSAEDRKWLAIG